MAIYQELTFGLSPVSISGIEKDGSKYLGSAKGLKASVADAGYIDFKAKKQFFHNKALLQVVPTAVFSPAKPRKAILEITAKGSADGNVSVTLKGASAVTVGSIATVSTDEPAGVAAKIAAAWNANTAAHAVYDAVADGAKVIFTSLVGGEALTVGTEGYTPAANGPTGAVTVESAGAGVGGISGNEVISIDLYSTNDTSGDAGGHKVLSLYTSVNELNGSVAVPVETMIPSNAGQYLYAKITSASKIVAGDLIVTIYPRS